MNGEHTWIWKEAVVTYFKVKSRWLVDYTTDAENECYGLCGVSTFHDCENLARGLLGYGIG